MNSEEKPKRPRRQKASAEGAPAGTEPKLRATRRKKRGGGEARTLVRAAGDKAFWLWRGGTLMDLRELRDALASGMSDAQFAHHVGTGRNDFACWVEEVLDDPDCARALRQASTREEAMRAVELSLAAYAKGPA